MASRRGNRQTEHAFSQVPKATIPRSQFNRSHGYKTTFDAGYLIPIFVDEVLPGDTFNLNLTMLARLATPIFPIMDNIYLDAFFFYVPNRLVWDNWQKFCGEQASPGDSTDYTIPILDTGGADCDPLTVFDYMGIPINKVGTTANALPLRCYNLIWSEWFRDQNLQTPPDLTHDDGPDGKNDFPLRQRGKRHDYFTSCLPWPSKGPGVELPLGDNALVVRQSATSKIGVEYTSATGQEQSFPYNEVGSSPDIRLVTTPGAATTTDLLWGENTGLEVDLSTATASTINTLRQAFQIQKLFERDARGGTRYVELVKSHFGVTSPDYRLQRPEYLGGGSTPLIVSEVAQTIPKSTAAGWTQRDIGTLSGFATAQASGIGFNKSFTEHGYIIGLVSARADLSYQQGLHRMWSRSTRYDFYWPAFANLGEQAVLNGEIYYVGTGGGTQDTDVFGYQERWAEYRYKPSLITGQFRSEHPIPLDSWHLAQEFSSLPILGDTFIKDTPPIDRVVAVQTEPHFIFDSFFTIKCARPMPVYSVPGLIDHF